jgi:NADH:ubiquinone oxidoreductase subunit H
MFFLGEYCNMILISVLFCVLFLGGWTVTLSASHALLLSVKASFIWVFCYCPRSAT